jgi:hypothetical protein
MSPAPLRYHQNISFKLSVQIGNYLSNKSFRAYAAPFDVRLLNKRKKTVNAMSMFEELFTVDEEPVEEIEDSDEAIALVLE